MINCFEVRAVNIGLKAVIERTAIQELKRTERRFSETMFAVKWLVLAVILHSMCKDGFSNC